MFFKDPDSSESIIGFQKIKGFSIVGWLMEDLMLGSFNIRNYYQERTPYYKKKSNICFDNERQKAPSDEFKRKIHPQIRHQTTQNTSVKENIFWEMANLLGRHFTTIPSYHRTLMGCLASNLRAKLSYKNFRWLLLERWKERALAKYSWKSIFLTLFFFLF